MDLIDVTIHEKFPFQEVEKGMTQVTAKGITLAVVPFLI